jgi:hypothetical protein
LAETFTNPLSIQSLVYLSVIIDLLTSFVTSCYEILSMLLRSEILSIISLEHLDKTSELDILSFTFTFLSYLPTSISRGNGGSLFFYELFLTL